MGFIELTLASNAEPVLVNVRQIVAIAQLGKSASMELVTGTELNVIESQDEVIAKIRKVALCL